jgi:hypothetical protein
MHKTSIQVFGSIISLALFGSWVPSLQWEREEPASALAWQAQDSVDLPVWNDCQTPLARPHEDAVPREGGDPDCGYITKWRTSTVRLLTEAKRYGCIQVIIIPSALWDRTDEDVRGDLIKTSIDLKVRMSKSAHIPDSQRGIRVRDTEDCLSMHGVG